MSHTRVNTFNLCDEVQSNYIATGKKSDPNNTKDKKHLWKNGTAPQIS